MKLVIAGGNGTVGTHTQRIARERGHNVVVVSRRTGHDLETGRGLGDALAGADAVIDVSSVATTSGRRSRDFFRAVTRTLQQAALDADVGHYIALSIVGIDDLDASYYAGKLAQERAVHAGPIPYTLLRTTQFHEFAEQVLVRGSLGPLVVVPTALIRPVAAREVGARLVQLAEAGPSGRVRDLTGPRNERLVEMVRTMLAADGVKRPTVELSLPGTYWRGTASGVLRGTDDTDRGTISFDSWLRHDHQRSTNAESN